jgi:subtilisin family serine protease
MAAGWPNLPTDGSSHITKKVEEAINHGIAFVVPSGNFANKHWEGMYSDFNLNGWHEFSGSDEGLSLDITKSRVAENRPIIAYLMWDEGLADYSDFQLVLVDPFGQIVDYSANVQASKNDARFEYIYHMPETEGLYALGIVNAKETKSLASMPNAVLEIFTPNDELEYQIAASSVSVPADASGAIVVGAVNHLDGVLEPFSSQGPTNDGKLAPHVVGPDGVTTLALQGEPFFGTSATAPYIAGLAALLLEKNPDLSPKELLHEIQQNTQSQLFSQFNEFDNTIGYGQANAIFMVKDIPGGSKQ